MVTRRFQTEGLDGLCSERQLELLNAIDSLRSQGISYYISLPQIIVCGDQSSGKSSILEALSGVSFPVKGNLCTRFPTELVLRKAPYESVKVTIVPDQSRSKPEQEQLATFHVELEGLQQLSKLIEEAKNAMGISPHVRAFAKDLLKVEISGPSQPHLTIVDLPGLIHTETKYQTASEVQLVHELVQSYMNERRSIILAVVSAKNDHANQIVLKLARQADPKGMRTIGVITKPDTLVPGSATEGAYLCLANNQDVEFRLGWHALKNMDTDAGLVSLEERNVAEEIFFSEGSWKNLPDHLKGVKKLRERLSKELLKQIAIELPNLLKEIDKKIEHNRQELNRLGEPRASIQEQRLYLVRVSQNFQALVNSASSGVYNDEFFGDAKTIVGYQKRIRAVIQNLNDDFAKDMSIEGQAYTIVDDDKGIDEKKIRRKDYLTSVQNLMRRTRGCELPGTFNPMIVMNLFLEQSTPWERIAMKHVGGICEAVKQFAAHICDRISDEATSKRLYLEVVEPALLSYFEILKRKTMELLVPHQKGHPITYNHYLTENLQKARGVRQKDNLEKSLNSFFSSEQESAGGLINPRFKIGNLLSRLCDSHEQDMVNFSCIEALDCMKAYYKVALKRFVDDIAIEAVETCLISTLPNIFSPMSVTMMDNSFVTKIAGESEENKLQREKLHNQLSVFTKGLITCKHFVGECFFDIEKDATDSEKHAFLTGANNLTEDEERTDKAVLNEAKQVVVGEDEQVGLGVGKGSSTLDENFPLSNTLDAHLDNTDTLDYFDSELCINPSKKKTKKSKVACDLPY